MDNFFPGEAGPNEIRVSVRNDLRTIFPLLRPAGNTAIADESLLNDVVTIGCKADGRPKARISWFRMFLNRPREDLTANSTSDRQGRSFLSVDLIPTAFECAVYFCEAENGGPTVVGQVQVCPLRKLAE